MDPVMKAYQDAKIEAFYNEVGDLCLRIFYRKDRFIIWNCNNPSDIYRWELFRNAYLNE